LVEFLDASKNRTGVTSFSAELQKFRMLREAMEATPPLQLHHP
jgi:hypothetical protein